MNFLLRKIVLIFMLALAACCWADEPKREFRGAWLKTVGTDDFSNRTTSQCKAYVRQLLDELRAAGCNAVIFQVRPTADAFYDSDIEPWSRWLTGTAGKAPSPRWDPMEFMVEEAHARGMEFHAWVNPYRVSYNSKDQPAKGHEYYKHRERFVKYNGQIFFDPAYQENRDYITRVITDIVRRYDIDAIHLDDYFYPYPARNKKTRKLIPFPDDASYKKLGKKMDRGDWRRQNVNKLIEQLHQAIRDAKPWVRLGISPFGIWRNKKTDPRGSDTSGLEGYDELYGDVLLWSQQGWVDYVVPQLYWDLESRAASVLVLSQWWNDNANGRHIYLGHGVRITMDKPDIGRSRQKNQLAHKVRLSRQLPCVQGVCWWPGYDITGNYKGIATELAQRHQTHVALVPSYPWIDNEPPGEVRKLRADSHNGAVRLHWKEPKHGDDEMQRAKAYVVYRFDKGAEIDLENSAAIRAVVYGTQYEETVAKGKKYTYVVTALDRANNESPKGQKIDTD